MKCYTSIIPFELAKEFKDVGYNKNHDIQTGYQFDEKGKLCDPSTPGGCEGICEAPTYAEAIDWLMEKGLLISIQHNEFNIWDIKSEEEVCNYVNSSYSWQDLADFAIEKAIRLLWERK